MSGQRPPMTPERFQSRDVKRRIATLERARDRAISEHAKIAGRFERLEARLIDLEALGGLAGARVVSKKDLRRARNAEYSPGHD